MKLKEEIKEELQYHRRLGLRLIWPPDSLAFFEKLAKLTENLLEKVRSGPKKRS